jgi:hypothetical protein
MRIPPARLILPWLAVLLFIPHLASGQQIDDAFRADIEKLLEASGASRVGSQIASIASAQIINGMKASNPSVPDRAIAQELFDEEFKRAFSGPDSIVQQTIPIYPKHFTHDEVRGLLAFYSTPLGQKTIQVMPQVVQEGAAIGQQWFVTQMPRHQGAVGVSPESRRLDQVFLMRAGVLAHAASVPAIHAP